MFKALTCFLVLLVSSTFSYGQQTCYESKPPQLKLSCENVNDNVYLRIEILDVTNAIIKKQDVYMGSRSFNNDDGRSNCNNQMQLLKSSLIPEIIEKPHLIALCDKIQSQLVRIVLKPHSPYVSLVDMKELDSLEQCLLEMNKINN